MTQLILAHIVEWTHCYIFRHWPYRTCLWVSELWPEREHNCWMCKKLGWGVDFRWDDDGEKYLTQYKEEV